VCGNFAAVFYCRFSFSLLPITCGKASPCFLKEMKKLGQEYLNQAYF